MPIMAVTSLWYGNFWRRAALGEVNLGSDEVSVLLLDNTYTPDQDAHQVASDLSGEVSGTGYTTGGEALTSVAVSYDGPTNELKLTADDVSWTSSTITARYAVVVDTQAAAEGDQPLIVLLDFGEDVASMDGPFTIEWDADGIASLTVD